MYYKNKEISIIHVQIENKHWLTGRPAGQWHQTLVAGWLDEWMDGTIGALLIDGTRHLSGEDLGLIDSIHSRPERGEMRAWR